VSDDYAVLAPIYESLGMAAFAEAITPQLIAYAQSNDWIGRRIVELGCGTGASVRWLANRGYNITGIDSSPSMLKTARESITNSGISFQLQNGDIRALKDLHDIDLVLALDVLNEMNSLRDLEAVFRAVASILAPEKLFVFDLHTIEGLAERNHTSAIVVNQEDLAAFLTQEFDFDRQARVDDYLIFRHDGTAWQRHQGIRTLRGFPIQVVVALLQRAGFGIMAMMNTRFDPLDPAAIHEPRVLVFARRVQAGTE
jgi:SAM-dependent methyltransferase